MSDLIKIDNKNVSDVISNDVNEVNGQKDDDD